ncbi:MAG: hypothetical protein SNJ56_03995 [Termitinemataceae bacterium]
MVSEYSGRFKRKAPLQSCRILRRGALWFLVCTVLLLPLSCREFFTTSLAPWAARDPASLIPPVSVSNIDDLVVLTANNPDQALALLGNINNALNGASPADVPVLQAAAVEVAANASGISQAVLAQMDDLMAAMGGSGNVVSVISEAIGGLSNLSGSATLLEQILPDPNTDAFNAFVAQSSPEALAMAAIVLLAAEAQASPGGVESFINGFDPSNPNSDTQTLAVALAAAAAASYAASGGTGPLADILSNLNLTNP